MIRAAVGKVFNRYFEGVNMQPVVQWFDLGGSLKLGADVDSAEMIAAAECDPGADGKDRRAGSDCE